MHEFLNQVCGHHGLADCQQEKAPPNVKDVPPSHMAADVTAFVRKCSLAVRPSKALCIRHLLAVGVEIQAIQQMPEQGHQRTLPLARGAEIRGSYAISAPSTQEGWGCAAQEGTGIGSIAHTLRSRMRLCHSIALTAMQPFNTMRAMQHSAWNARAVQHSAFEARHHPRSKASSAQNEGRK